MLEGFWAWNSGGASSPRATATVARGFTCRREIQRAGGDLHILVGCEQRRYLQNTKNTTSKSVLVLFSDRLLFLPLFQICFSFSSFTSEVGHCTRRQQAKRVDGWIGNFRHPPSFLHRRCRPPLLWLGDRHPWSFGFLPRSTVLRPPLSFPHRLCNELLEKGCCCWLVDGGWPRGYWSWRWRWGVAVALLARWD